MGDSLFSGGMSAINMLDAWQWALLAVVPPAIVLLYFLKLKRQPLEVPSTYLWLKSIEDLHVNSIWQRLRQSLLLVLQLLFVALIALALLRPGWRGSNLLGDRFIFLVDTSASMSATDVDPSRLAEAKRRVGELIDQMASGDVAMIVSFSDSARVEQPFTDNRRELRRRLEEIEQTNRTTALGEALRVAAGLANPGRAFEISDTQVAEGVPAAMYIFSDGKFPDVQGFSLGHLKPVFVPIGQTDCENVGIAAFSTKRPENKIDQLQAFARLDNFGPKPVKAELELYLNDALTDASNIDIKPQSSGSVVFDLGVVQEGVLKLLVRSGGQLKADDVAWTPINPPQRSRVLLVTPGNEALELALTGDGAKEMAEVSVAAPAYLEDKDYQAKAASAAFDLIVFDRCVPKEMPQANTLFIGRVPPAKGWQGLEKVTAPQVIDVNTAHPLMQLIELGNVNFYQAIPLRAPPGSTPLIDTNEGLMFAIGPREGFEDAALGAEIVGVNEKGERYVNTDWPLRLSFPVFILNVVKYLADKPQAAGHGAVSPGSGVTLHSPSPAKELQVRTPAGKSVEVKRDSLGAFNFAETDLLGVYEVRQADRVAQRFAVNLFSPAESDIRPRADNTLKIGYVEVKGESAWQGARREAWKALLLVALVVLLFEWYIYNRRVYL